MNARGALGLRALAWVATLIAARGHALRRGMIVMTGRLIPTAAVAPGEGSADAVPSGCRSRTGAGEKLAAMAGMRAGRRSDVGHADASLPV